MSVYQQDITDYFDPVAARGIELSRNLARLAEEGLDFGQLNGSPEAIANMQESLYDTLYQSQLLTDCSGVYFMLIQ